MAKEQLHDCPHCARKAFTAAGLKAHLAQKHKNLPRQAAHHQSGPKAAAPGKVSKEPLTLAKLDVMPAGPAVALKDLSLPQLAEAYSGLDRVEEASQRLSGIVATLKGLVLLEVKGRLKHGKFMPWIKEHFPKSQSTATRHLKLAAEFSKFATSGEFADRGIHAFDLLTQDLSTSLAVIENNKLDLANPVVAQVAAWTEGKSAYQLLLELDVEKHNPGGNHHPKCPHCQANLRSNDQSKCPKCGKDTGFTPDGLPEEAPGDWAQADWNIYRKAAPEQRSAMDEWLPVFKRLGEGFNSKSWANLPDQYLRLFKGLLIDLNKQVPAK